MLTRKLGGIVLLKVFPSNPVCEHLSQTQFNVQVSVALKKSRGRHQVVTLGSTSIYLFCYLLFLFSAVEIPKVSTVINIKINIV